jgi:ADP-heptose:LPS heptosyltransferase
MSAKEQALLFRVGGLGDLLVALPAIALARRNLAGYALTLVGRREYGELLKLAGIVDEALSFEHARITAIFGGSKEVSFGGKRETDPTVNWLKEYSLAMGWLNRSSEWPPREWWQKQGMRLADFTAYESGPAVPMSRFFFDRTRGFLEKIGTMSESAVGTGSAVNANASAAAIDCLFDKCARLTLSSGLRKKAVADLGLRELKPGERRLVVHPGSGGRAKRWPLANFFEVIRRAGAIGVPGVLVTGQAETDLEAEIEGLRLPDGWSKAARLPAETLAGLLSESTHNLGNDSGPTHLAAACGASVLALFRADNLPAWRPFGKTRVLASPAPAGIDVESVWRVLQDLLAAR